MDLSGILNSDFVKNAGAAGLAFLAVASVLLFVVFKLLPKLNQTWAEQMGAERQTWATQMGEDRKLFREIHEDGVRASTERHTETMRRFDTLEGMIRDKRQEHDA